MMDKNPKSVNPIPLLTLIDAIRDDLIESAKNRPANWKPLFRISEATVETSVTFHRDVKFGGKLKVFVAEIGPETDEQAGASHRLVVKLKSIESAGFDRGEDDGPIMRVVVPAEDQILNRGADLPAIKKPKKRKQSN